jgi:GT2 family glycosyltransferase
MTTGRPLGFALRFTRPLQRCYVRAIRALWRVDLRALFDEQFYTSRYPDVAASGADPLFHFLRYGAAEGRLPNPLFDSSFYLARYPDVARSGYNPLLHFLRFGGVEGRQPHPDFDSAFYLANYPDVARAGVNPLIHFLLDGAAEGRLPSAAFDPEYYMEANPDVAASGVRPALHFARLGAAEMRPVSRGSRVPVRPEWFLPVGGEAPAPAPDRLVDVIVPVYKGFDETLACLESVLSNPCAALGRVLVINDASPDPELVTALHEMAGAGRIELLENDHNLGFVRSVNRGMADSARDVLLLNSDTVVAGNWLDRLWACAYAEERTGTVTPFSNNATICSYPVFCADNELPPSLDAAALDAAFALVNRGRSIGIPTAIGFCMYIRRDCLRETGLFDAEAFGPGYGEENDFCMRSAALGWDHKLACDVFVYHAGRVSFGEASGQRAAATRVLASRHPAYATLVSSHCHTDPASAYRIAVTAWRIRNSGRRVFLAVDHHLGGGVRQHIQELIRLTAGEVIWLTLRPVPPDLVVLECSEDGYQFTLTLHPGLEYENLTAVLKACGTKRIHIHHLMGHVLDLERLVEDLGLPLDFTLHDYFTICPQITLSDEQGRYCGEPGEDICNRCIASRPPAVGPADISSWRAKHGWVLMRAERVIAPSADVALRIARYYPEVRIIAAEHHGSQSSGAITVRPLAGAEKLRVAVLGGISAPKGLPLLQRCAEMAAESRLPLEFGVIGFVDRGTARGPFAFFETGRYEPCQLPQLIESAAPHVVWFPARIPETFSYTMSTCLDMGLPVAAHGLGAFPERVAGRPWSWIVPSDFSAADWIDFFLGIRAANFLPGTAPATPATRPRASGDFYPERYLTETELPIKGPRHAASQEECGV